MKDIVKQFKKAVHSNSILWKSICLFSRRFVCDKWLLEFRLMFWGGVLSGLLAYNLDFGVIKSVLTTYAGAMLFFIISFIISIFGKEEI